MSDVQIFSLARLLTVRCVLQILYCRAYGHQAGTADEGRPPGEGRGQGDWRGQESLSPTVEQALSHQPDLAQGETAAPAGAPREGAEVGFFQETGNQNFLKCKTGHFRNVSHKFKFQFHSARWNSSAVQIWALRSAFRGSPI